VPRTSSARRHLLSERCRPGERSPGRSKQGRSGWGARMPTAFFDLSGGSSWSGAVRPRLRGMQLGKLTVYQQHQIHSCKTAKQSRPGPNCINTLRGVCKTQSGGEVPSITIPIPSLTRCIGKRHTLGCATKDHSAGARRLASPRISLSCPPCRPPTRGIGDRLRHCLCPLRPFSETSIRAGGASERSIQGCRGASVHDDDRARQATTSGTAPS
jgi:hypothetical protein